MTRTFIRQTFFFHINHYLKSVSKVALLHRFHCSRDLEKALGTKPMPVANVRDCTCSFLKNHKPENHKVFIFVAVFCVCACVCFSFFFFFFFFFLRAGSFITILCMLAYFECTLWYIRNEQILLSHIPNVNSIPLAKPALHFPSFVHREILCFTFWAQLLKN